MHPEKEVRREKREPTPCNTAKLNQSEPHVTTARADTHRTWKSCEEWNIFSPEPFFYQSMFYFMSVYSKVILDPKSLYTCINKLYNLIHRTMNDQFNNRSYNICIIQTMSHSVTMYILYYGSLISAFLSDITGTPSYECRIWGSPKWKSVKVSHFIFPFLWPYHLVSKYSNQQNHAISNVACWADVKHLV